MPKYTALGIVACSTTGIAVEADNPEDAADMAYNKLQVGICHQCSEELQVGDIVSIEIYDEDDNVVYNDNLEDEHLNSLKTQVESLKKELEDLKNGTAS